MTQRNGAEPFSKTGKEARKNVRTEEKADKVSMQQVGEARQEPKSGVRRVHKKERGGFDRIGEYRRGWVTVAGTLGLLLFHPPLFLHGELAFR